MTVDKNWSVNLFFDLAGTDAVVFQDLVEAVRRAVGPEWAVWGRPTGVVFHEAPHVGFSTYVPLSADPVALVARVVEDVESRLYLAQRVGQLEFAGCSIDVRTAVTVNWAPGVRGTLGVSV